MNYFKDNSIKPPDPFDGINPELDQKARLVNPFKVPEGYFDTLHVAVQDKIAESGKRPLPLTIWNSYLVKRRHLVPITISTFVVFFAAFYLVFSPQPFFQKFSTKNQNNTEALIDHSFDLENYYIDAARQEEAYLSSANLVVEKQVNFDELSREDIISYLNEQEADLIMNPDAQ